MPTSQSIILCCNSVAIVSVHRQSISLLSKPNAGLSRRGTRSAPTVGRYLVMRALGLCAFSIAFHQDTYSSRVVPMLALGIEQSVQETGVVQDLCGSLDLMQRNAVLLAGHLRFTLESSSLLKRSAEDRSCCCLSFRYLPAQPVCPAERWRKALCRT